MALSLTEILGRFAVNTMDIPIEMSCRCTTQTLVKRSQLALLSWLHRVRDCQSIALLRKRLTERVPRNSVTPYSQINPGYSIYSIDPTNYQLIDKKVYIANLSLARTWDRTGGSPQWFQEYSARDYLPSWPANRYLDADFWNQVVTQMNVNGGNNPTFETYFKYRGKSAGLDQVNMLNVTGFRQQIICDIKAGDSAQECSRPSIFKRDLPQPRDVSVSTEGHGGKWWKKELCSNHHGDVGSMLSFMRE